MDPRKGAVTRGEERARLPNVEDRSNWTARVRDPKGGLSGFPLLGFAQPVALGFSKKAQLA
jgi:hypothetical protein